MSKTIRQKLKPGIPLPALNISAGGGISKAFLTLLLMLVTTLASASDQISFRARDFSRYSNSSGRITLLSRYPVKARLGNFDDRVEMTFEGAIKTVNTDWAFRITEKTRITFKAPSGYKIREVYVGNNEKRGAQSGFVSERSNWLARCTVSDYQFKPFDGYETGTWSSYDAPASEVSFYIGERLATVPEFNITLVKDVESWISINEISVGIGETKVAGLKLNDYKYNDINVFFSDRIASYDFLSDKIQGLTFGNARMTLQFNADDNYARGTKNVNLFVTRPLAIPKSDRYTVTVTRNGTELHDGDAVKYSDQLTYRVSAHDGYQLISPAETTLTGADDYPTPSAMKADADGYMLIANNTDWENFARYCFNVNKCRLNNDIGPVTTMAGFNNNPFTGTFDGQGHTLTVNYENIADEQAAPFRFVRGATFTNLRTTGTISASKSPGMASGLIGDVLDGGSGTSTTIRNCESAVALTFTGSGDATHGGFIGRVNDANATVNFYDCLFSGSMTASEGKCVGGFVGLNNGFVNIYDCLMAGSISVKEGSDANGNATFARTSNADRVKIENSYYREFANIYSGFRQGTGVSDQQMANGEAAWQLQCGRDANRQLVWGQTIDGDSKDARPVLTTDIAKRVWRAAFKAWNSYVYTVYANNGNRFNIQGRALRLSGNVTADGNKEFDAFHTSEDGYMLIEQNDDWDSFADAINRGCGTGQYLYVRLMNNINVSSIVGGDRTPFRGIFDGNGHNININYDRGQEWNQAPFRVVSGATIQNLSITGQIRFANDWGRGTTGRRPGGLVGKVSGGEPTVIRRCIVSPKMQCLNDIRLNQTNPVTRGGGIVGHLEGSSTLTIENCIFNGIIESADIMGGMVGIVDGTCIIKNSLMIATLVYYKSQWNDETGRTVGNFFGPGTDASKTTIENSYYMWRINRALPRINIQGGTEIDNASLTSGKAAWLLQGNQSEVAWGQNIGRDDTPSPTTDAARRVFRATFTAGDTDVIHTAYANKDRQFNLTGRLASLNGNQPATKDVSYKLFDLDKDGYVDINNTDDWNTFALCNSLQGKYRLMKNISVNTMTSSFYGSFDGQNHTLTVDYTNATGELRVAPFRTINGATFTNLRIAGSISANASPGMAAGLAGNAEGQPSTFTNCESAVNLTFTGNGDATHGGFLGRAQAQVTFNNCAFTGSMTAANGYCVGGFVGWAEQPVKVNNSLVAGDIKVKAANNGNNGNAAFVRNPGQLTLKDSYVLPYENLEVFQGTNIDATQLESGMAAYLLQGIQTNQQWGQTIGTDTKPQLSSSTEKHVFKADYMDGNIVAFTTYANRGVAFPMPAMPAKVTYLILNDVPAVIAQSDTKIPYSNKITLKLPQSEKYIVTAKLGDQPLENGGIVTDAKALTFNIAPTDNYMLLSESVLTMHQAGTSTFVPFNEPATLAKNGDYIEIGTIEDWNKFAQYCPDGNFRLTADIDNVTTMVGNQSKPFTGTFDGQGHTLTVNLNYGGQMVAPFSFVKGATIKYLKTAGTVTANDFHASGLVGRSFGVTIDNCEVDVDVQYTKGDDAHNGGFVGHGGDNDVTITNSAFNGKFSSPNNQSFYGVGGFVGWGGTNISIKNCYAHYQMGQGCQWYYPFIYKSDGMKSLTLENCYAANAEYGNGAHFDNGNENCTQVGRSQVESGEMAYKLQGTQESQIWGQAVGTDKVPQLTSDAAKRILENVYDDGSKIYDNCVVISESKGNKSVISANNTAKGNVKLVRKFAEGWNTLVVPFDVPTDSVNKVFGKDVKVAYFTNNTPNTIELSTKTDTKDITANEPVLVYVGEDFDTSANTFIFNGVTVKDAEAKAEGARGVGFVGSYDSLYTVKEGEYFISGTNLWKSQGNTSLKATRAYFTVPEGSTAKIMLRINDGTTTGISSVRSEESGDRSYGSAVYTLSGQKVADSLEDARKINLKQGVYIVNGKKMVIK